MHGAMYYLFAHFARIPFSITDFLPGLMRNMIYTPSSESQDKVLKGRESVTPQCQEGRDAEKWSLNIPRKVIPFHS